MASPRLAALLVPASLIVAGTARAAVPSAPPDEGRLQVAAPAPPAAPPAPAQPPPYRHCGGAHAGAGVTLVPHQLPGGYLRLQQDLVAACATAPVAPLLRLSEVFEGWFRPNEGGFSLPVVFTVGAKIHAFVAAAGAGFNLFTVDRVAGVAGGGIFSPRVEARLGFHKGVFSVDALGTVQRRWQWKLDTVTMFQAGLTAGVVTDLDDLR
jgi:hypothetical protein